MSYTNKTEFYEIPLPIETDLYDPMDYNESMEAVDTALHGAVQNASTAVDTANTASDAAAAATSGLEALSETVNTEKGKLTALTARVTAAENEIDDVRSDGQDAICAFNEPTATSTHAYAIGDYFFYNNVLYRATAAIAISDTIVPNTNCEARNVTSDLIEIHLALSSEVVRVSGDGVKTYAELLTSMCAALNAVNDLNLKFIQTSSTDTTVYVLRRKNENDIVFSGVIMTDSGDVTATSIKIANTNSTFRINTAGTPTDYSSSVVPVGVDLIVTKNCY